MIPYPDWLNAGDNAWQLVAATLVGLMSIPGIALLYGGLVQRKWVVNTMLMAFTGFSLVLVVWVLWGFNMGFGKPWLQGPGILHAWIGRPASVLGHRAEEGQAHIPLVSDTGGRPPAEGDWARVATPLPHSSAATGRSAGSARLRVVIGATSTV